MPAVFAAGAGKAEGEDEGLWQVLAPVLFVLANGVFATLMWQTLKRGLQGRLLPNSSK